MPGNFPQFESFPREIQLMVFEEFLIASLSPRIVVLNTAQQALFAWDNHVLGWQWSVGNNEQLARERPEAAAMTLFQVNDPAREVARRFLSRLGLPISPPRHSPALIGFGLSLWHDIFWLPDDLRLFIVTAMSPPVVPFNTDGESICNIMISLDAFEEALRWASWRWQDPEQVDEYDPFLRNVLVNIVDAFPSAWDLIIMVDVPRGEVSWDQIHIVRAYSPALLGLPGDGFRRCRSAYMTFESLNYELEIEQSGRGYYERALPVLSFAFRRLG